jgi:hypothetical protein
MSSPAIREVALARLWQDGRHARELRTVDGRRLDVDYRGVWTHGDGPDFRDALLEIDGQLQRGAVELHVHAADWRQHGHHLDPAYDAVILHVVLRGGYEHAAAAHGPAGRAVATLELASYLPDTLEDALLDDPALELGTLGARVCLPTLAGGRDALVRDVLRRAGWRRLTEKQLRVTQEFERLPPAEVLFRALLDGLGLTANRIGMAQIADRLPLRVLERLLARHGVHGALAGLLGVGGFLPLATQHAALAQLAPADADTLPALFEDMAREYELAPLSTTVWELGRVRPANHPVRRLASGASLLAHCEAGGLLDAVLARAGAPPDVWRRFFTGATPPIGRARADQLAVNVVAPFLAAYADAQGDETLAARAGRLWEALPGTADDAVARDTLRQIAGDRRVKIALAVEAQGLHQIGRHGCAQLRCFECPIAELATRYEPDIFSGAVSGQPA